jgi:two-component system, cell cycle sensor histidine kinase and response regulator CckA
VIQSDHQGRGARRRARREVFGRYPPSVRSRGEADDTPGQAAADARETILLVEDEPAVRQLFAQALTRAGYRVYEARNGQEALKVFDQHGESIDLLLTDIRMPFMGGNELAQQLRARRSTLKLLCVSGYSGGANAELASDFLAKPFSRDDLLAKVREVLDRK